MLLRAHYIDSYAGPPPPASGTVQRMYSCGILMEQHLQWTQFCALITNLSPSGYSYTRAGQKRLSGAPYVANDTLLGTSSMPSYDQDTRNRTEENRESLSHLEADTGVHVWKHAIKWVVVTGYD